MLKNNFFILAACITLSGWIFFYKLGDPNFYHVRNESRRAEIAREMLETGNYIVPHLEKKPILTKPPLFFWAIAFFYKRFGVTELAARMPSAIAGVGTVLFTFLLGSSLFNRNVGCLATLILMTTNMFMDQVRSAEMESLLTFFITGSIYCFFRAYQKNKATAVWYSFCFAMMGLGTMTKGPFAFTFPLIPIVSYLWIYHDKKVLISKPFLFGMLFFFMIILPWPLLILKMYPQFFRLVLVETIGRVVTGFAHQEPFYYYFKNLWGSLFPWIFFLPFAVWICLTQRCRSMRRENLFLLFWFLGNLIFLSLSKSKREFYLLPVTPAVALLLAATWKPLWLWAGQSINGNPAVIKKICLGTGVLLAGISFYAGNPLAIHMPSQHFPHAAALLLFLGLSLLLAVGIKIFSPRSTTSTTIFIVLVSLSLSSQYCYLTYTVPIKNIEDSGKHFYIQTAKIVNPQGPLAFYCSYENYAFTFYAQRPIETLKKQEDLEKFMNVQRKRFAVLSEKIFKKLSPVPWKVVLTGNHSEHRSWGGYLLLCNE